MAASATRPVLQVHGPVRLVTGERTLDFADERRFRLAAFLAVQGDWVGRDALATLFWPERPQAQARSNLRKLLMELRSLDLPGLEDSTVGLRWPVQLHRGEDRLAAAALQGLSGGDSPAFENWLRAARQTLEDQRRRADYAGAGAGAGAGADVEADRTRGAAALPAKRHADEAPLLGRADDLQAARSMLIDRRCRLLTITGAGGIGKSTLALELLPDAVTLNADGVYWIALEDLQDVAAVLPRIARELGLTVGAASDGWSEVQARLARGHEILVLDNAEHLDALRALVERLLDAVPTLRCVVSSRRRLSLATEWTLPLEPLELPAARRLFLRAALAAPARETLRDDDTATLAEVDAIVERLGRLPLAIGLAAAWTRHLSLHALRVQLQDPLPMLAAARSPDGHPAHASIAATFDRSWRFLDAQAQQALTALAVCPGSTRFDLALQVSGAAPHVLAALADASLIRIGAETAWSAARAAPGATRVSMHPLVREFASAQLGSGEARARALARHAEVFATLCTPWREFDDIDSARALAELQPEIGHLLQAWDTALALQRSDWFDALAASLSNHYQARGGLREVLPRFQRALALLQGEPPHDPAAYCRVGLELAVLQYWIGDADEVEATSRSVLRTARSARLARPARQALNNLAVVAQRQGRPDEAARRLQQALDLAQSDGAVGDAAIYSGTLAGILFEQGELDRADTLAREALQTHRRSGHTVAEQAMLHDLGRIAHQRGDLAAAFDGFAQALVLVEQHAMAMRRPVVLACQASVRLDQDRLAEAHQLAERALDAWQRGGQRVNGSMIRRTLAEVLDALGRHKEAAAELRAAVELVPSLDGSSTTRGLLSSAAVCLLSRGDAAEAAFLGLAAQARRTERTPGLARYHRAHEAALAACSAAQRVALEDEARAIDAARLRARLVAVLDRLASA